MFNRRIRAHLRIQAHMSHCVSHWLGFSALNMYSFLQADALSFCKKVARTFVKKMLTWITGSWLVEVCLISGSASIAVCPELLYNYILTELYIWGGGGLGVTSAWSPLRNFIKGQAHPGIDTDIFSDVFCKIFVHSICVFFIIFFSLYRLFS